MTRMDEARALVKQLKLSDELKALGEEDIGSYAVDEARLLYYDGARTKFLTHELTADVLAESLHHLVLLKGRRLKDEQNLPLGSSKTRGLPHLPAGFEWPAGQYFAAQINLAELHPHDARELLPATGLLSFFYNGAAESTVVYSDVDAGELVITPYPDASTLPGAEYYLESFVAKPEAVELDPRYVFYIDSDAYDHSALKTLIPESLQQSLSELLGCSMLSWDSGTRLFGRPLFWQGEDEDWGDEDDENLGPDVLLFQDEFGEGNVHFWLSREALAERDFSQAWLGYSGT